MAIPLRVRFITLATPEEAQHFSPALRELCGILTLTLPPLREHPADIPALFMRYLRQYTERAEQVPRLSSRMEQLLSFYHWPGNLEELSAVCQRYLYTLSMEPGSTVNTRCRLLTNAIGEQALFQSLLLQYPALSPGAAEDPGQFQAGVAAAKEILGYGNAALAEKLGLSRTTLWRKLSSGSSS